MNWLTDIVSLPLIKTNIFLYVFLCYSFCITDCCHRFQMFCSFIMALQSLHPRVTEVYVVALTILTPAQKLITKDRSNPLSKTRLNGNVSPTFIFKFWHVFIYLKQTQKHVTQKSILKINKNGKPIPGLKIQWYNYRCAKGSMILLSLS